MALYLVYGEYVCASSSNDCLGFGTRCSVCVFTVGSIAMHTQSTDC